MVENPLDFNKKHNKTSELLIRRSSGNSFSTLSFSTKNFFYAGKYLPKCSTTTENRLSKRQEIRRKNENIISNVTVKGVRVNCEAGKGTTNNTLTERNLKLWPENFQNNFFKVLRAIKALATQIQGSDKIVPVLSVVATIPNQALIYPGNTAKVIAALVRIVA